MWLVTLHVCCVLLSPRQDIEALGLSAGILLCNDAGKVTVVQIAVTLPAWNENIEAAYKHMPAARLKHCAEQVRSDVAAVFDCSKPLSSPALHCFVPFQLLARTAGGSHFEQPSRRCCHSLCVSGAAQLQQSTVHQHTDLPVILLTLVLLCPLRLRRRCLLHSWSPPIPLLVQVAGSGPNCDSSVDSIARDAGPSLAQVLRSEWWLELTQEQRMEWIKFLLACAATALLHMHTKGRCMYRDLKLENCLFQEDFGILQLADFGLTVPIDADGCCVAEVFSSGMSWGDSLTHLYTPPKQFMCLCWAAEL